jgi:hypothetical protein
MNQHRTPEPLTLSRRGLLLGAALGVAGLSAACGSEPTSTAGPSSAARPSSATSQGSPPAPTVVAPTTSGPDPSAYEPASGEVLAGAKRAAGRLVAALATYDTGQPVEPLPGLSLAAAADWRRIARAAAPLRVAGQQAVAEILYAQLGGSVGSTAAVMVVVRQRLTSERGDASEATRTVDVRLERERGRWRVSALGSAGGARVARPRNLSAAARSVLDNPDIELPDSAVWDIHRGDIDDRLLQAMARLAERTPYAVSVLKSGHPYLVFGTSRVSNHSRGRAVDIYAIGKRNVVDQRRQGSGAFRAVRWVLGTVRPSELGSPWDVDGGVRVSFTNTVHQDHIHIGYDR